MSFIELNQRAQNPNLLQGFSHLAKPDSYRLTAQIMFERYQPNWLSKDAIRTQFGQVVLPSNFVDLPSGQQLEMAKKLANNHYKHYAQQIPSEGRIANYVLVKNDSIVTTFEF